MKKTSDFKKIVERNRKFFEKQKKSLIDQKNVDLTQGNIRLDEIVDFVIWSALRKNNRG